MSCYPLKLGGFQTVVFGNMLVLEILSPLDSLCRAKSEWLRSMCGEKSALLPLMCGAKCANLLPTWKGEMGKGKTKKINMLYLQIYLKKKFKAPISFEFMF